MTQLSIERFAIQISAEQRKRLMEAWLHPSQYADVANALPRLKQSYVLAVLSNGTPGIRGCVEVIVL